MSISLKRKFIDRKVFLQFVMYFIGNIRVFSCKHIYGFLLMSNSSLVLSAVQPLFNIHCNYSFCRLLQPSACSK